jgi:RHS repeat-associated protein
VAVNDETFTTTMSYDQYARVETINLPSADGFEFGFRFVYDENASEITVIESETGTETFWELREVDGRGRIQSERLGNGTRTEHSYHPDFLLRNGIRTRNASGSTLADLSYVLKGSGRIETRSLDTPGVHREQLFTYDAMQRLQSVTASQNGGSTAADVFEYSPSGRLLSRSSQGSYAYQALQPHAVSSAAGVSFTYDGRGNQVTRSGVSVPGARQEVQRYTSFDLPALVLVGPEGEPTARYRSAYSADQERIVLREEEEGTEIVTPGPYYERLTDGSGNVRHVYRIGFDGESIAERTFEEGTGVVGTRYLHRDERGSVIFTTNEDGVPSAVQDFDILGSVDGGSLETPVNYTGKRLDKKFGLLVMGVRMYDPGIGLFTTPDALLVSSERATGLNPYAYANNDPVNFRDPTGLCAAPYWEGDTQVVTVCESASDSATWTSTMWMRGAWGGLQPTWSGPPQAWQEQVVQVLGEVVKEAVCLALGGCGNANAPEYEGDTVSGPSEAQSAIQIAAIVVNPGGKLLGKVVAARRIAAAEKAIVAANGTKITGYATHGLNRAIGDGAQRAGTKVGSVLDALKNPKSIKSGVDELGGRLRSSREAVLGWL